MRRTARPIVAPARVRRSGPALGLALLVSCATPAPKPAPTEPPPPLAPPTTPACRPPSLEGPWLIEGGSATLSCDDGTRVDVGAGGNIRVERGVFIDGACRF